MLGIILCWYKVVLDDILVDGETDAGARAIVTGLIVKQRSEAVEGVG